MPHFAQVPIIKMLCSALCSHSSNSGQPHVDHQPSDYDTHTADQRGSVPSEKFVRPEDYDHPDITCSSISSTLSSSFISSPFPATTSLPFAAPSTTDISAPLRA